jgi:N-dimethylarginine dimethylaminohydrolase
MNISQQSDIAAIGSVLIKHARDAFVSQETCDSQWQQLNYKARPDFAKAVDEYDGFVEILRNSDIDIHFLSLDNRVGLDSIYTAEASFSATWASLHAGLSLPLRKPPTARWKFQ